MKIKKLIVGFAMAIFLVGCSENEDFELFNDKTSLQDECILDCEIDDGGPGGTTLPDFSNYFYVHRGNSVNNGKVYWVSSNDGSNWTTGQLGLGAKTSEGPSTTIFDNKRFIFYKGNHSANIFFSYQTQLSNDWYGNVTINSVSETGSSIASIVFDNKIFLAFKGRTNGNLYLAHSSTGTAGSFTQVQALSASDNIDHYVIAQSGNKMYVFWSNDEWNNAAGRYERTVYYRTNTNPTNGSTWSPRYTLETKEISSASIGGLSAVTVNDDIYVTYGTGFNAGNGNVHQYLTLGKLTPNGAWTTTQYSIGVDDRVGVMATNDSKLLISYIRYHGDNIRTMKVNLIGTIDTSPYVSGGLTRVGGVASHSKFN